MPTNRTSRTPQARAREDWAPRFLAGLEETHMVTWAAKRAGVGRRTVYDRRERDAEFRAAWDEVEERSTEELEQIAVRRASEDSDPLMMFLLNARRPGVYREHHVVEHAGMVQHRMRLDLRKLSDEQLRALEAIQPDHHQPDSTNE